MVRDLIQSIACTLRRSRGWLVVIVAGLLALAVPSGAHPPTLDWQLARVARPASFDVWSWEISTLVARSGEGLAVSRATDDTAPVWEYARLSRQAAQAEQVRDRLWARQAVEGPVDGLTQADERLLRIEQRLADVRPVVESTVSQQIDAELHAQRIRDGLLTAHWLPRFPFVRLDVVPGVFFQLGPLPNLLVIAPRDRIELIGSVLLRPRLDPRQIDVLESQADRLDVSSVVTGIGGLAVYPSLVPDDQSVHDLLITVAHEWTHHYLALRPLGMAYFSSYAMREINETVADMVGHEVGSAVYRRYYARTEPPAATTAPSPAPSSPRPDFQTLMREVRVTVEAYLAQHDVAGAEAYMATAQQNLAHQGYYVRRLNTAYLAFFGSYAATANPYERKLRELRAQSGSLAAFLHRVAQIRTPADLDRLLGETPEQSS